MDLDRLNREVHLLEDRSVALRYQAMRSIATMLSIVVLIPLYFTGWLWTSILGTTLGIYSMVAGFRIKKRREEFNGNVKSVQEQLK